MNGEPGVRGQQIRVGIDRVSLDGRQIELQQERTYLMLNKPAGVISSVGDPRGRPTVVDGVAEGKRLFPVGRLDLASRGLILLTDDGELAMRLMHPSFAIEKEYHVLINGRPTQERIQRISKGLVIGAERFQPAKTRVLDEDSRATRLSLTLREGRKREVRRMLQAVGHQVLDLQRVRIDGLHLGDLREGAVRPLTAGEIAALNAAVS